MSNPFDELGDLSAGDLMLEAEVAEAEGEMELVEAYRAEAVRRLTGTYRMTQKGPSAE